ncbi:MAG: hypothetical protein KDA37_10515 [Planctomycetales bacterium]|nr:hypothetical protein [Planctomycetales bacterium]
MVRSLLGAILGAVLGAAVFAGFGAMGVRSLWPVVLLGVVCGIAMRWMTKQTPGPGHGYLSGALAAVAVIAAIFGGNSVTMATLQAKAPDRVINAAQKASAPTDESGDAAMESVAADSTEPAVLATPSPAQTVRPARRDDFSVYEGVWIAIGALIAYELGKGETFRSTARESGREPAMGTEPDELANEGSPGNA